MLDKMNVPELRFSEFQGKWSRQTFKDLKINVIDGDRGTNYPNKGDLLPEGDCLFLTAKNVTKYGFKFSERQFITKQKDQLLRNGKLIRGDIILTTRGSIGHKALYSDHITFDSVRVNSGMVLLRNEWTVLSNDFVYKSMFANNFTKQIGVVAFGSAQPALTVKEIYKLKLSVPPTFPEQQKIASFLSTVDKKIELLIEKKAKLTEYKKGVMQQLFNGKFEQNIQDSLGGKTTFIPPTLRFKTDDGSDFPDWEEKRLSDICIVNPRSNSLPKTFKYIDLEAVNKGSLGSTGLLDIEDAPSRAQRLLKKNDIIYQCVRPYQQNNYLFKLEGVYVASTGYAQLRAKIIPTFVYYTIHTEMFSGRVMSRCTGTSYPAINSSDLAGIKVGVPKSEEEQIKIASFLSSIDQKIDLANSELDKAKEWKKGLLQQMFV
jgi:type I restriction enzyme S subunit